MTNPANGIPYSHPVRFYVNTVDALEEILPGIQTVNTDGRVVMVHPCSGGARVLQFKSHKGEWTKLALSSEAVTAMLNLLRVVDALHGR